MFLIVNKPLWRNQAIKRYNIEGALRVCKFLFVDCVMVGSLQVLIVENVQYVSMSSELLKKNAKLRIKIVQHFELLAKGWTTKKLTDQLEESG